MRIVTVALRLCFALHCRAGGRPSGRAGGSGQSAAVRQGGPVSTHSEDVMLRRSGRILCPGLRHGESRGFSAYRPRHDCDVLCTAMPHEREKHATPPLLGRRHMICGTLAAAIAEDPGVAAAAGEFEEIQTVQRQLRALQTEEADANKAIQQLDYLVNNYQLSLRLQLLVNQMSPEKRMCGLGYVQKIVENLRVATEYYSLYNQAGKKKLIISDSYPGQKLALIKKGLAAVDQDITNFMLCYGVFPRLAQRRAAVTMSSISVVALTLGSGIAFSALYLWHRSALCCSEACISPNVCVLVRVVE
eukprot:gnl/TRDRNA2_/TRDRNA2_57248_c0_seq1.p1 gnl/TRDRNA2_/TRDRNA2_57248_c0~~gnl/TRDRNA2_/TRDRNA2_57248_c0_seq1.p1  ORF type:complete len:303 (+),score=30.63 gnl/TRDRNA2_/TRDRNA2_57248_c0_seq1:28-936(+)